MKLELDEAEVKVILLEYAQMKFPDAFDAVEFDMSYGMFRNAVLSKRPIDQPVLSRQAARAIAGVIDEEPL